MPASADAHRWSLADRLLVSLLLLTGAAIGTAAIVVRPDLTRGAGFLFGDEGFSLYVAEQLLRGRALYVDVAYMYGFVPAFLYAGWAFVFGNTPSAYLAFHLVVSLANTALAYALVRRFAATPTAALVCFAGLLPLLIVPGAIVGGYISSPYQPLERTLMLVAALVWRSPLERTPARGAALGALLGSFHAIRFGTGAFMLLAVLLVDAAVILFRRRGRRQEWIRAAGALVAAFLAMEAVIVALLFAWLPVSIAADVAWPAYMLRAFDEASAHRWPAWEGWRAFAGQYLTVLSAVALTIAAFALRPWSTGGSRPLPAASAFRRQIEGPPLHGEHAAALFVCAVFFLFGCLWFFRSVHHFRQFAWTLVIPAAWALQRHSSLRALACVLWLPMCALLLRSVAVTPPHAFESVTLADGGTVALPAHARQRVETLARLLQNEGSGAAAALMIPNGAGFHAAFDVPAAGRHVFFFQGAVQPDEIPRTIAQFREVRALVVCAPGEPDAANPRESLNLFPSYFPRELANSLQSRIAKRVWSDGDCGLFRLHVL